MPLRTLKILLLTLLFPITAEAATLSDFPVVGAERIQDVATMDMVLSDIPDGVAQLYAEKGGRIYITDYTLDSMGRRYGFYSPYSVHGLYFFCSCRIYAHYMGDWLTGYIIIHELGHFLFHETRPSWTAEARARFPDDEDFAETYARHHLYHDLSAEDAAWIESIEAVTNKLKGAT